MQWEIMPSCQKENPSREDGQTTYTDRLLHMLDLEPITALCLQCFCTLYMT